MPETSLLELKVRPASPGPRSLRKSRTCEGPKLWAARASGFRFRAFAPGFGSKAHGIRVGLGFRV